jgi:PKD repeat protein
MRKIKLPLYTLALCLSLLGFVNIAKAASTYTLTAGADPSVLASWKKSPGGTAPTSFILASQTFQISVTAGAISAATPWIVSGSSSKVVITSGGILSDNATHSLLLGATQVQNGGTLILVNNTFSLGTFIVQNGSTVNFAGSGTQTIPTGTYYNLIISGTGTINDGGVLTVATSLTINAACALTLNGAELDLNGTLSGTGTITGDNTAIIIVNSAGSIGTLNLTSGSTILDELQIQAGSVTFGNDLLISGGGSGSIFDQSGGSISLNGHTLTLDTDCNVNFSGSSSNVITGSATSALVVNSISSSIGIIGSNGLFMDQTTAGTSNALSCLTLNGDQTLTIGNTLNIIDSILPKAGTIASGGFINLVFSSAVKTGRVGVMDATGAITGNVTSNIQRPAGKTDWVLMGYPGIVPAASDFTVYEGQFPMECPSCPDGFSATFTSVDYWSETAALDLSGATGYTEISNTTDPMSNGTGYWFFMGLTYATTAAIPITVTGAVQSAAGVGISMPLTANHTGYNLLANPVPSPISWSALRAGNGSVSTTYYVYSPNYPGGANYTTWDAMTGGDGSGLLSDVIAQGQGFYVVASAGTSLTLFEGAKRNGGTQGLAKQANPTVQSSNVNYFKLYVTGGNSQFNSATFEFNSDAIMGQDIYDAKKLPPGTAGALTVSSASYGTDLTINALPGLTQNYSIPVKMTTATTGSYQISPADMQYMPAGVCIKLHDNYTGTDYDILQGAFNLTLTDTETVARFTLNVTVAPLAITTNANPATCHSKNDGLITAVGNDAGPWNYTWKDATGTVIKTTSNKATADSLTGLNNGVYTVEITTVGSCNSATQTFTVVASAASTSAFTASAQANVGSNINFTNASTNATNYIWNFGDGDISSQQTPVYAYNSPGTYTITLSAINASCNDTAKSTQIIQVNATTGIKQANVGNGDINISKDATGNYIQFDYANQTKVNINVYNVLGQTVLNNPDINVVNDKIYLNVTDNKNQVLYVTIINLNNNQQTTKKFVND